MSTPAHEDLERELKKLYSQVAPPPRGLLPGKERMLTKASRLKAQVMRRPLSTADKAEIEKPERRRKMNLLFVYKILAAVIAVVIAITGTGGSVVLAADSLPGDFLYPVKLVTEDIRLLLTMDSADGAELAMTFATERVEEMERLATRGELVPDGVVARMTHQMEQTMAEIAQARPGEVPALLQRVMERTRTQQQLLEGLRTMAREETRGQLRLASQVMERAHVIAGEGLTDPSRFQQQYRYRHEGMLRPLETVTPSRAQERQQNQVQDQNQEQYQNEGQYQNEEQQQNQEQEQNQGQDQNQQQDQNQEKHQNQPQDQNQEQYRNEEQYQNEEQHQNQEQQPNHGQDQSQEQCQNQEQCQKRGM